MSASIATLPSSRLRYSKTAKHTGRINYENLDRAFYKRLLSRGKNSLKLIDYNTFANNPLPIATELYCKNGKKRKRIEEKIMRKRIKIVMLLQWQYTQRSLLFLLLFLP